MKNFLRKILDSMFVAYSVARPMQAKIIRVHIKDAETH